MEGRAARCAWEDARVQQPRPCDRYKHACAVCRGFVYLYGGRSSTTLRDFWRYHTGELAPSLVWQDSTSSHHETEDTLYLTHYPHLKSFCHRDG